MKSDTLRQSDPDLELLQPFLKDPESQAAAALYALYQEIRQGVLGISDSSTSKVKLAWWRDELLRLLAAEANHPLSREVQALPHAQNLDQGELLEPLEQLLTRLDGPLYDTEDQLLLHAWRGEGAIAVSAMRLAGHQDETVLNAARDLGLARGLAQIVIFFEAERQHGRCWLPLDYCRPQNTQPEQLLAQAPEASLRLALLTPVQTLAQARYDQGLKSALSAAPLPALKLPAMLAALESLNLSASMRNRGLRRDAGPFRRLFTAWRMARKLA